MNKLLKVITVALVIFVGATIYFAFFKKDEVVEDTASNTNTVEIKKTTKEDTAKDKEDENNSDKEDETDIGYNPPTSLNTVRESIEIEYEITPSEKGEVITEYTLDNGKTVKIRDDSQRGNFYTDSDVKKAINNSSVALYDLMNFDTYHILKILDRIEGKFGDEMRIHLETLIETNLGQVEHEHEDGIVIEFENEDEDHVHDTREFPINEIQKLNEGIQSRKVNRITLTEMPFEPPYLSINAIVESEATYKNGDTKKETNEFIITFNNHQERQRAIYDFELVK